MATDWGIFDGGVYRVMAVMLLQVALSLFGDIDGQGLSAFGVSTSFRLPVYPTFYSKNEVVEWAKRSVPITFRPATFQHCPTLPPHQSPSLLLRRG
jgi:hypothetical protein